MPKVFFDLTGDYEGLRVKRLRQAGRLVLDKVINDGDPYWSVSVLNFKEQIDRPRLAEITGSEWGNGTERFVCKKQALARFEQLASHAAYVAEAEKEKKRRAASSTRLRERHARGQVTRPSRLVPAA